MAEDFSKAKLLDNVAAAVTTCRELIKKIDNRSATLWSPALGVFDFEKKKTLKDIQQKLPFSEYLYFVNDLKIKAGKKKAELDSLVNSWNVGPAGELRKLNMAVSEDLRAFSSFCVQPVKMIENYLVQLEKLAKK